MGERDGVQRERKLTVSDQQGPLYQNAIVIFGSSRPQGYTQKVLDQVAGDVVLERVDLGELHITPFDYEHRNRGDDFLPLMEKIVSYDTFVVATPVYWYQMSTHHKIFFDRFSDLLMIRKDLGRKLAGKNLFVIASCGSSHPLGFEDTFAQICAYLNMHYLGTSFVYSGQENRDLLQKNTDQIQKAQHILGVEHPADSASTTPGQA